MATATFRDESATAGCSAETALPARPDASPARELIRPVPRAGG
ncbi:hypothetical protein PS9374_06567 [Planomonospora sphaerica]|uniref:Uncharacterized protein n=1 Tax=Planomonospora sphaerica TaxID=161355 RepID=A0A161LYH3_9ACTN|nr:hypothetical protein PS9374_06567 [Planomonospora sphaerica]